MVTLHVEPTSRCTLGCPRCERTTFIDKFGKNNFAIQDLDINKFCSFINIPIKHINFCGNLGDPIYHRDFLNLVQVSKQICESIGITTNGSRKSKQWWKKLVSLLDSKDIINFSIDGSPENFTKYRINGDWNSVKDAIEVCAKSDVKTIWKYIPFSFNENNIENTKELANKLGIDEFLLMPSDRWIGYNDPLRPQKHFIGNRDKSKQQFKSGSKNLKIDPRCKNNSQHYIGADGTYAPCCDSKHYKFWYKSEWYKNKMTIKDNKLSECIRRFDDFYATIQDSKPDYCLFNCGKC
jgi:MoaA/NifB/PqqE/SkfB family radical SAM enzyme